MLFNFSVMSGMLAGIKRSQHNEHTLVPITDGEKKLATATRT